MSSICVSQSGGRGVATDCFNQKREAPALANHRNTETSRFRENQKTRRKAPLFHFRDMKHDKTGSFSRESRKSQKSQKKILLRLQRALQLHEKNKLQSNPTRACERPRHGTIIEFAFRLVRRGPAVTIVNCQPAWRFRLVFKKSGLLGTGTRACFPILVLSTSCLLYVVRPYMSPPRTLCESVFHET